MSSSMGHPPVGSSHVAINGIAARLPGANTEAEFWSLLTEGRCSVGALPEGRWSASRYHHPRVSEPGFSYSFAGGYLDQPFNFDPSLFGISPREAAEMDPQQRLLLEVVWSALEDAGIPPSAIAGRNVGVYVGASSLDYGNLHTTDPASIESHFMTGNTLSVLSNRISYIYDLQGPSFTVDTACSSSLVAFAEAQAAIASGRIDMAIVAGVNLLLSPTSFIGFARASMLSPSGLCRPFSAAGDGYVRAEGAVAMLLSRLPTALEEGYRIRAVALASGINSDGKTSGISLPSMEGQRALLHRLYGAPHNDGVPAIDANRLAFVEAHGTGTKVGDPAEATAIGEALGQMRDAPLLIGSVKSNIGHLEPASGLAGLYKAVLSLEHRVLPPTLHLDEINPAIDFARLNLTPATHMTALPATGTWLAGISSFGFGGTNAHVVIRQAEPLEQRPPDQIIGDSRVHPPILVLSAHSKPALAATASHYADLIEAGGNLEDLAAAVAWQRDLAPFRLAMPIGGAVAPGAALRHFAANGAVSSGPGVLSGVAPSAPPKVCFVFSGNGCQWAGMGRLAFARNGAFRDRYQKIDALFGKLAGWSLTEALHDPDLSERLKLTRVAQPLLFALQSSIGAALKAWGLEPDMVLGHSVGEVAAAEAAGALSLKDAIHVIYHRSEHQEGAQGLGTMAVASLSPGEAKTLIAGSGLRRIEIAAINSPNSVTLSGPEDEIRGFSQFARKRRIAVRVLDLAYPFHSAILEPLRGPLLASLQGFTPQATMIPFISTVSGDLLGGTKLDGDYWWRNVRQPVLFSAAIDCAGQAGGGLFIEIGPRPILAANISDSLREGGFTAATIASLVEKEDVNSTCDPLAVVAAGAIALGCRHDRASLFGARPALRRPLPPYAWQRKAYRQAQTSEALDIYGTVPRHPLIGARLTDGTPEWRSLIDATRLPFLADHRIDGEIVMPGAAFAEMALAVAREIFPEGPIGLEDFDLLQWLPLREDSMRELSVRLSGDTNVVEIWSRPRLGEDEWTLCARGRVTAIASKPKGFVPKQSLPHHISAAQVYASASEAGVDYGPSFQRVLSAQRSETVVEVVLSPVEAGPAGIDRPFILHPIALDAAFHAMFENIKTRADERYAYLPVRFANLRVDQDGGIPVRAHVVVDRETDQSLSISVDLYDQNDRSVAGLTGGLFRAVTLDRRKQSNFFFHQEQIRLQRDEALVQGPSQAITILSDAGQGPSWGRPDSWLLLEAFGRSLAFTRLGEIGGVAASALSTSLLYHLQDAGLASLSGSEWTLADESGLPDPTDILATFVAEYAEASAEILLAAQTLAGLDETLRDGKTAELRPALLQQFESQSILFAPLMAAVSTLCEKLQQQSAPEPLRILLAEPSCLGLLRCLAPLIAARLVVVTVVGTDGKQLNHTAARRGATEGVAFVEIDADDIAETTLLFDLGLAFAMGPLFGGDSALGRAMARRLAPNGLFCALVPPDNILFDLLLGAQPDWFSGTKDSAAPIGRMRASQDGARLLVASGFCAIETFSLPDQAGALLLARPDQPLAAAAATLPATLLIDTASSLADLVGRALKNDGRTLHRLAAGADFAAAWAEISAAVGNDDLVEVIFPAFSAAEDGLERSIAVLAGVLQAAQAGKCRLWILVQGLQGGDATAIDPTAEALWCFARVAVNEYPAIQVKLVDIAPHLASGMAEQRFAALLAKPGGESELLIDLAGLSATRTLPGLGHGAGNRPVPAARLEMRSKGLLGQFDWIEYPRRAPGPGEVEVAIAASGLNFRDIMLATGLLDDDVLDDGLAGAVFGFECAGHVVAVGSGVTDFQLGDAVMGFGRQSFATHTTADAGVFTALPEGLSVEAAATIPVAFLTAWYALVHQAQIQPGEWVLIHGAAGGVGLAAMQIARLKGARIAATVSTPDKRALVALMGAEKIYNSRSIAFKDRIQQEIGGVDVVLNSLAGDAMLASLKCLKPFGRFIELGKRDYVLNSAMGLRPFRRNLTYFGVDLDQLLAANLPLAKRLMGDLVTHFASGAFAPLPYRVFDWFEAGEAFQLMQSAGHVGKLIVRPNADPVATRAAPGIFAAGPGVHLVVGGAGGFGFETVAWLAEKGARTIVIASRRGHLDPEVIARAAALEARGVDLVVTALDVTDPEAVTDLTAELVKRYGRIAGVMHAAMVLDDGLIAGLEPARTHSVLAPKVEGALNLDRATSSLALDYFVAFSSATTMIGNPGQAAYVTANGFLQGLMQRRRAEGRPGLAIAWGAIADAGVLVREGDVAAKLERISGIVALKAQEALSQLDGLLADQDACPATVYCASFRPGAALQALKLLATPSFNALFSAAEGSDPDHAVNLADLIAGKSDIEARTIVTGLVAQEVARILRLSVDEIDVTRPLDDLGMDSLMSLELRMSIEGRFGVELPVVAISSGLNVGDLATRLIAGLDFGSGDKAGSGAERVGEREREMLRQHAPGEIGLTDLIKVTEAIEDRRATVTALL